MSEILGMTKINIGNKRMNKGIKTSFPYCVSVPKLKRLCIKLVSTFKLINTF